MARLIALEWDASEVRLAVARTYGSSIHVDHLESVARAASEDPGGSFQDALSSLASGLDTPADVLLNIPRGDAELRLMELPLVPEAELPEIVRLQAARYFTALNDDWVIDFLPLSTDDTDNASQNVLAAALDPATLERIEKSCSPAELVAGRIAIRSFSSASAWVRRDRVAPTSLLVDLLEQEVDLTVVHGRQVVLSRNARLPRLEESSNPEDGEKDAFDVGGDEIVMGGKASPGSVNVSLLQGEVRRTIVAANNQMTTGRVEQVVLLGTDSQLAERLAESLDLPVELYSWLDQFEHDGPLPPAPERFTALLGVLADEAAGEQLALDFLHPRQPPRVATRSEKTARYGLLSFVGLAVVAVIVATLFMLRSSTLAAKLDESRGIDQKIKDSATVSLNRKFIDEFTDGNVVWLDEISLLSDQFPSSDDAIVRAMTLSNSVAGGGRISMDVNVSAPEKVGPMENKLRDFFAAVRSDGMKPDEDDPNYKTRFKQTIDVLPRMLDPVVTEDGEDSVKEGPGEDATEPGARTSGQAETVKKEGS